MRILKGLDGLRTLATGAVLTVGNFDGMHRGHQRLLEMARQKMSTGAGSTLAVVTFEPHPLTVLRPEKAPPRLTPPAMKHALLEAEGVQALVELPPTHEVLDLTAERFWAILRDDLRISHLVEGHDFNFGKGRTGSIENLRQWAAATAVTLDIVEPVKVGLLDMQLAPISSSLIRWLIANGRVRDAAICLGRPYVLEGTVVEGFRRGRTIGYPTANLHCQDQLIPMDGVYVARCRIGQTTRPVALSIGSMPTFDETSRQIEGHIIGHQGDLYGQTLQFELIDWLRDQRKYPGVEQLKQQLSADCAMAAELSQRDPARVVGHT